MLDDAGVTADQLLAIVAATGLSVRVRAGAAGHPALTGRDVLNIVQTNHPRADFILACTTQPDVLDLMADHHREMTRCIVAFNPAVSALTLEQLADDARYTVRVNAGLNGNLSRATRSRLALHDEDVRVRTEVHWAITTTQGRAVLEGARFAVCRQPRGASADPVESRVLAWGG